MLQVCLNLGRDPLKMSHRKVKARVVVQQHEDPREEKLRAGRYMGLTKDKHFTKFSVQFWYFC